MVMIAKFIPKQQVGMLNLHIMDTFKLPKGTTNRIFAEFRDMDFRDMDLDTGEYYSIAPCCRNKLET
jgi:hypothetical protein